MTTFYLVQHAEKQRQLGDPGLTALGREQAATTAQWLARARLIAVYSSPLRRALQTAQFIASASGLQVQRDDRLRERMNWADGLSIEEFMADWAAAVQDRNFVPRNGESSRQTGERVRACLKDLSAIPGAVAVVTHGGATVDLLRTLVGDDAVTDSLLNEGVPSCAITTLDGMTVLDIASLTHLTY